MSPARRPAYVAANFSDVASGLSPATASRFRFDSTAASLTLMSKRDANRYGRVANQFNMRSLNELSPPGLSRRSISSVRAPALMKERKASSTNAENAWLSQGFGAFGSDS